MSCCLSIARARLAERGLHFEINNSHPTGERFTRYSGCSDKWVVWAPHAYLRARYVLLRWSRFQSCCVHCALSFHCAALPLSGNDHAKLNRALAVLSSSTSDLAGISRVPEISWNRNVVLDRVVRIKFSRCRFSLSRIPFPTANLHLEAWRTGRGSAVREKVSGEENRRQSNDPSSPGCPPSLHVCARYWKSRYRDTRTPEEAKEGLSAGMAGGAGGRDEGTSHKERGDRGWREEREVVRGRVSRYSIGQKSIQGRPG